MMRQGSTQVVGAQAVYIDTSLFSQRELKINPFLFKRVHEIEKMESDNVQGLRGPWRGSGLRSNSGLC
jgi:hypothetical protein